jgi:hypothetical protein
MRLIAYGKMGLLLLASIALLGCASTPPAPYGETFEPDSPASMPTDIHPEQAATFSNRTIHN